MKALLLGPEACPYAIVLKRKLSTPWELHTIEHLQPGTHDERFESADVLISVRYDDTHPSLPSLKLFQAASTGVNAIKFDALPPHVPICNAYGHEIAIAEYVILGLLSFAHQTWKIHEGFVKGHWYWSEAPIHPTHGELYGKTLCVIGLGRIGRETAKRAKVFGMRVIGCNRTTNLDIPEVDEIIGIANVAQAVASADFVVVACALTDETLNLVDARVLAAMKKTAVIVNIARATLIDEAALYQALLSRQIGGAVLDAWYRYPTRENRQPAPSDWPFAKLDNVLMTPHISGWTDGMVDRRWGEIARNLDSLASGKPLINVVRAGRAVG